MKSNIRDQYFAHTQQPSTLEKVFNILHHELQTVLRQQTFKIHSLGGRVNTWAGLEQKISRPDRNYDNLFDVTDLIAFRIITYSEDLIENVARLIDDSARPAIEVRIREDRIASRILKLIGSVTLSQSQ